MKDDGAGRQRVRFGIVLLPNFTLTALSGFVDVLRLASDEGDQSRPERCAWEIIGESCAPIRSSCGIRMNPWTTFDEAGRFDYVVVVGGLLHSGPETSRATLDFLRRAAAGGATLVGVCTGTFALVRAGLMDGKRICVSWFHYWDFLEQFPAIRPGHLVADRLFVTDGDRITCSGGRSSIDVAATILARHIDPAYVHKALRILQVDGVDRATAPQAHLPSVPAHAHPRVRRAILLMEQHMADPLSLDELAARVDVSVRQLERLFKAETGVGPQAYGRMLRLRLARWLLTHTDRTIAAIAGACGFADASHMGREFRVTYGTTPTRYRAEAPAAGPADAGALDALPAWHAASPSLAELYPGRVEFH